MRAIRISAAADLTRVSPALNGMHRVGARTFTTPTFDEIGMLEKLLADAKARKVTPSGATKGGGRTGPKFQIGTFNNISPVGLKQFDEDYYNVKSAGLLIKENIEPHALLLRSHKLQASEVTNSVRCIARCGAGVNNIPVEEMTSRGIPVFNTPGANANSVKEAVVCALLLASRGIYEGIRHTKDVIYPECKFEHKDVAARIEKDKKMFVGHELQGRTLGVIGLGQIGGRVVEAALALGMNVIGYDPVLTLDAAWRLPGDRMEKARDMPDLLRRSDYVTLHVPYSKETHHLLGPAELSHLKSTAHVINFSRAELVDSEKMRGLYDRSHRPHTGKYICDFADMYMHDHPKMIILPHLGASTEEAEENSAAMAAQTVKEFLTKGEIRNSVNFPTTHLEPQGTYVRLCLTNLNQPGVLGAITTFLGNKKLNIMQQLNMSRGRIAYTVVDLEKAPVENLKEIQEEMAHISAVLSSRFIGQPYKDEIGMPGSFYKVYGGK